MVFDRHRPPYKLAGAVLVAIVVLLGFLFAKQYRGDFVAQTEIRVLSGRAGLVVDPGSKVTLNGVEIGRVARIDAAEVGGTEQAMLTLEVQDRYLASIPSNVIADVRANTVFGNKYVSFSSPETPSPRALSRDEVIRVQSVTTEFNTLFETVTSIADKVDPIKLNQTLTAAAEGLTGLGSKFGESLENANVILGDVNPLMPRIRTDVQRTADLADVYAAASPDIFDGLDAAVIPARTLNAQLRDVDAALMAAVGFGETAADPLERAGPFLVRSAADLMPTTKLLDDYRGMIFCSLRNYHDVGPRIATALGGDNGYSLAAYGTVLGAGNPYIYPDNLPRINAHGGPEGRPGCWQKVTYDLWPHPYLVMDTGFSLAPYNHIELGQPIAIDYVWGRQIGELTINP
ncbi:virulence factor Mce family protein [Mycobacterium antarcticum]|uniref:MCE family protein n=1 Tax=unclassified Mycolicibacterium TaxID=2636767 RepID=UPI00238A1D01|nr:MULTISPECIES: MCE family protein [unclassified Mycolicibacterium]BDX30260.1 virulence factor Mce family protein [Mycolicibacterium sp. TUM20985]GLP79396.1 virulence factor Mce family protein [Mycolicibacterium sp. TUM20984]